LVSETLLTLKTFSNSSVIFFKISSKKLFYSN